MSKQIVKPYSEVTRVSVTNDIWGASKKGWPTKKSLQDLVDFVVSEQPPVKDTFTKKRYKQVKNSVGQTGVATFLETFSGDPHLTYRESHIEDIAWIYPKIGEKLTAGPRWAS